jgi:hypothetical protein
VKDYKFQGGWCDGAAGLSKRRVGDNAAVVAFVGWRVVACYGV